ncbi:hypothetical protein [Coleofasciculus sp. H7-2]|uniref:hypothetical protein n=1 Tax=Coleofasciculus sp. H7-2 TaxID=3351545 RepID=UPI00366F9D81
MIRGVLTLQTHQACSKLTTLALGKARVLRWSPANLRQSASCFPQDNARSSVDIQGAGTGADPAG